MQSEATLFHLHSSIVDLLFFSFREAIVGVGYAIMGGTPAAMADLLLVKSAIFQVESASMCTIEVFLLGHLSCLICSLPEAHQFSKGLFWWQS